MATVKHAHSIAIAMLLAALQIQACATTLTEEQQYERQARQAERIDEIRLLIAACESAGMIAVYDGRATHKLRDPMKHIPRHAHPSDYACGSERDMQRALRAWGLKM